MAVTCAHLGQFQVSLCPQTFVCVCVAEVAAVAAGVWDSLTDDQNVMLQIVNELGPDAAPRNCTSMFCPWGLGAVTSGRRQCWWIMRPLSVTLNKISGHLVQQNKNNHAKSH